MVDTDRTAAPIVESRDDLNDDATRRDALLRVYGRLYRLGLEARARGATAPAAETPFDAGEEARALTID